jgi:hypothetical protein
VHLRREKKLKQTVDKGRQGRAFSQNENQS